MLRKRGAGLKRRREPREKVNPEEKDSGKDLEIN